MPPKGPDKKLFALRVTLPTWEWLREVAGDNKVPTHVAQMLEKMARQAERKKRKS